eukprot:Trichotokara_eunicae@DN688_c0_g1_i1.p1
MKFVHSFLFSLVLSVAATSVSYYDEEKQRTLDELVPFEREVTSGDFYHLKKKIGSGTFSEVFEATESGTTNKFAVKLMKQEDMSAMEKEIRILEVLEGGPYIVKVKGIIKTDQMSKKERLGLVFE